MQTEIESPSSDDSLSERYAAACEAFVAATCDGSLSQAELVARYESEVFPLACERMRRLAERSMVFDTLYLTAGTQPYSQTLSMLATPAKRVVFIATDDPICQACVNRAAQFADLQEGSFETHVFPEPFSISDMTREIYAHATQFGGERLAMDITSGRKVMSAALAALASELGIQQFYLYARFLRGSFAVDEKRLPVPSVRDVVAYLRQEETCPMEGDEA